MATADTVAAAVAYYQAHGVHGGYTHLKHADKPKAG